MATEEKDVKKMSLVELASLRQDLINQYTLFDKDKDRESAVNYLNMIEAVSAEMSERDWTEEDDKFLSKQIARDRIGFLVFWALLVFSVSMFVLGKIDIAIYFLLLNLIFPTIIVNSKE